MNDDTRTDLTNKIVSRNPADGQVLQVFEPASAGMIENALAQSVTVFKQWRKSSFAERSRLMLRCAELLESSSERLGRTMSLEMGKPIGSAIAEARKCASACRFYAEHAEAMLRDEPIAWGGELKKFIRYQPLGPVLAVMPWNFPFWQVFRFAAPSLMAGNVALLKHASNVPQCALAIEALFREAGFPEGVFQALLIGSRNVPRLIEDPRVCAVTLTGSVAAGASVAAAAGGQIKKTVLELGGSDPFIVMPSADIRTAAAKAVEARVVNNGQSCIAAKRFIVHRTVAAQFEEAFVRNMAALRIGDPLDPSTQLGPLATAEVLDSLQEQVRASFEAGARVLLGGKKLSRPGFFFEPTVLAEPPAGSPAQKDELFGPVATIFFAEDIQHALRLANDSVFGLGASIWTNEPQEQQLFIDGIEAGSAFVNSLVVSDPAAPFGGIKQSGYGRELAAHGLREFVNVKTVAVAGPAGTSAETARRTE